MNRSANTAITGKSTQTAPTGRDAKFKGLSLSAKYALSKQVPDLAVRGCIICTNYGDITVPPGRMCDRLTAFLVREINRGGLQ